MIGVGVGPGFLIGRPGEGGPGAAPPLFPSGADGAFYDPADLSTLFLDIAGTVPVTADGQAVARMEDTSGNDNHATNANAASRPLYRTDGTLHWLEFRTPGTDYLAFDPGAVYGTTPSLTMMGAMALTGNGTFPIFLGNNDLNVGIFFGLGNGSDRKLRLTIQGGTGGDGPLLRHTTAFALNQAYVVSHIHAASEHSGWIDGAKVMAGARSGSWTLGSEGRIGFTKSPIQSPLKFFGAMIVQRDLTTVERDAVGAALQSRSGAAPYLAATPTVAGTTAYALGDSTISAYGGQPNVIDLMSTSRNRDDVAAPGNSIAQQKSAWLARTIDAALVGWVVVQVGLNDMNPGSGTTAGKIAELQDLIDTIRADVGAAPILVSKMSPARQRWINLYGATDGPLAQQRWVDVNEAIAGQGTAPITGVQGRVTSHLPVLDDGAGNLAAAYDTGDGIHPNAAARQVIADAWEFALTTAGITV